VEQINSKSCLTEKRLSEEDIEKIYRHQRKSLNVFELQDAMRKGIFPKLFALYYDLFARHMSKSSAFYRLLLPALYAYFSKIYTCV
jgi:DNA polymerase III delta subunit